MGNVEFIELKTSRIQCPSCLHHAFTGAILCHSGKHIRPDLEMMRRWKLLLKSCQTQYFRTSAVSARACKNTAPTYGSNITTKQNTHYEERKRAKEILRRSGIDGKTMKPSRSLSLPMIGRMLGWHTYTILHKSTSPMKRRMNKEIDTTICFVYEVSTRINRHHVVAGMFLLWKPNNSFCLASFLTTKSRIFDHYKDNKVTWSANCLVGLEPNSYQDKVRNTWLKTVYESRSHQDKTTKGQVAEMTKRCRPSQTDVMDALVNVLKGEVLILHCHENGDCHAVALRASSELSQSADCQSERSHVFVRTPYVPLQIFR